MVLVRCLFSKQWVGVGDIVYGLDFFVITFYTDMFARTIAISLGSMPLIHSWCGIKSMHNTSIYVDLLSYSIYTTTLRHSV